MGVVLMREGDVEWSIRKRYKVRQELVKFNDNGSMDHCVTWCAVGCLLCHFGVSEKRAFMSDCLLFDIIISKWS